MAAQVFSKPRKYFVDLISTALAKAGELKDTAIGHSTSAWSWTTRARKEQP